MHVGIEITKSPKIFLTLSDSGYGGSGSSNVMVKELALVLAVVGAKW